MSPGDWIEESLCAVLGQDNWESLKSVDQRAICEACPVLEECATWAAQFRWVDATVAGRTYVFYERPNRRKST